VEKAELMGVPAFFEKFYPVVDFSPNLHYNTSMKRKITESVFAVWRRKNHE
jgi:hypothetical protein